MGLNWPGTTSYGGNLDKTERQAIRGLLDRFADVVVIELDKLGLPRHASPLWRPWNLLVVKDARQVFCAFSASRGGIAEILWSDRAEVVFPESQVIPAIKNEFGRDVAALVVLPLPGAPQENEKIEVAGSDM